MCFNAPGKRNSVHRAKLDPVSVTQVRRRLPESVTLSLSPFLADKISRWSLFQACTDHQDCFKNSGTLLAKTCFVPFIATGRKSLAPGIRTPDRRTPAGLTSITQLPLAGPPPCNVLCGKQESVLSFTFAMFYLAFCFCEI